MHEDETWSRDMPPVILHSHVQAYLMEKENIALRAQIASLQKQLADTCSDTCCVAAEPEPEPEKEKEKEKEKE